MKCCCTQMPKLWHKQWFFWAPRDSHGTPLSKREGGGGNSYMANFLSSGGWAFDFLCPSRFVVVMGKLTKYFFGRGKTIGVKIIDSAQFLHDTPDDFFLGTLMFHNTLVECHTLRFTALGGREKKYFWFKTRIKMIFFKLNLYRLKKFMGWWGIG